MAIEPGKTVLKIKLIPRSSRNEIVEYMGDGTLKIKLTAPPVEGKANQALVKYLSGIFDVSINDIEIILGKTSHNKVISIIGINQEVADRLVKKQIS